MFPIQYDQIWTMYKKAVASFWTVEEVDLSSDLKDWKRMTPDEKHFVKNVLAFFAASDGVVNENLACQFYSEVQISEARAFYAFQIAMETVHSEMYSVLVQTFADDAADQARLLNAVEHSPCIKAKADWALRYITNTMDFPTRLVAFACVEGIFFSSSFCALFWLKKRGLMPGLCLSNEFISRDEGLHTDFACLLYSHLTNKLDPEALLRVVRDAVELEQRFVRESLRVPVIGMNADTMCTYVEFCADRLLVSMGQPKHWKAANPYPFMELISLESRTNFFERRVSEYQKVGVMDGGTASLSWTSTSERRRDPLTAEQAVVVSGASP